MLDIIAVGALAIATMTGLITIHKHQSFFSHFRLVHVLVGRVDAVLYTTTALSTALCLADAVLRLQWLMQVGWEAIGTAWTIKWLTIHVGFAFTASTFHLVTHRLLQNGKICELCRRPF